MSMWPRVVKGRVCVPWWYGLGYPAWMAFLLYAGISRSDTMDIYLSIESVIALMVCAFVGSLLYVTLYAVSKYEKQRADAEKVRTAVAATGRDPTDLAQLTASEKWELTKAQHFDRIFLIVDIFAVLVSAGIAVAILYLFGGNYIEDNFVKYGVLGFIAGIIVALVLNETLFKAAAAGLWEEKSARAFRVVKSVAEDVAEMTDLEALIQKYMEAGLSKREAKAAAKAKIVEDMKD